MHTSSSLLPVCDQRACTASTSHPSIHKTPTDWSANSPSDVTERMTSWSSVLPTEPYNPRVPQTFPGRLRTAITNPSWGALLQIAMQHCRAVSARTSLTSRANLIHPRGPANSSPAPQPLLPLQKADPQCSFHCVKVSSIPPPL